MYDIEIYEDIHGKSEIKQYIKNLQDKKNKSNNIKFNKIFIPSIITPAIGPKAKAPTKTGTSLKSSS